MTRRLLRLAIAAVFVLTAGLAAPSSIEPARAAESAASLDAGKFLTLFPGIYSEREKALVERYFADNAALKARGPIDVSALIAGTLPKDTPGLGPAISVTEEWVRYNNRKYDPESKLRNDAEYARSLGYADILAYPTFGAHDDTFMIPYPPQARDKLLVSDLNHSVTVYKPIYPGDTLYLVMDARDVLELTPTEGSIYRSVAIQSKGSIYNQRGEKVNDVTFRVTESIKVYKDPSMSPKNPGFADVWEAPNWTARPAHFYSDKDWAFIKEVWSKEFRRGADALYWEDVHVGDRPAWTLEGPIEVSVSPIRPWGMGAGGSRTMKKEIMDPAIFKTMIRGQKDGIYRLPNRADYVPPTPVAPGAPQEGGSGAGAIDTTDIHKEGVKRSPLVNYMGREFAIRHISNWMGDRGWLDTVSWGILNPRNYKNFSASIPVDPRAKRFLPKIPGMEDKYVNAHGLTTDVAIVKSAVTNKFVRNGDYIVEVVWWIENIDGDIWQEGEALVRLPSKRKAASR